MGLNFNRKNISGGFSGGALIPYKSFYSPVSNVKSAPASGVLTSRSEKFLASIGLKIRKKWEKSQ